MNVVQKKLTGIFNFINLIGPVANWSKVIVKKNKNNLLLIKGADWLVENSKKIGLAKLFGWFLKYDKNRKKYGYDIKLKTQSVQLKTTTQDLKLLEAQDYQILPGGLKFSVNNTEFNLKLFGEFNIYNALAAICVGLSQGVDLEICKRAIEKVEGIPGRMETIIREPFTVIVDYAHTTNTLRKVYMTIEDNNHRTETLIIRRPRVPRLW